MATSTMAAEHLDRADRLGSCGIAVMAKASRAGRTKTRLSPPLTGEQAARINTAFLSDIALNLLKAATRAPLAAYMAYGPPDEVDFFNFLPKDIGLFPAWESDFGATLSGAIASLFERGHSAACVLNADSPTLPTSILVEAAGILAEFGDHIVLGPSTDGGYYLLGMKTLHARLFEDIFWSTEHVARQTLERAREVGVPVRVLPEWYDVDDQSSLEILIDELFGDRRFGPLDLIAATAAHTRALLTDFGVGVPQDAQSVA